MLALGKSKREAYSPKSKCVGRNQCTAGPCHDCQEACCDCTRCLHICRVGSLSFQTCYRLLHLFKLITQLNPRKSSSAKTTSLPNAGVSKDWLAMLKAPGDNPPSVPVWRYDSEERENVKETSGLRDTDVATQRPQPITQPSRQVSRKPRKQVSFCLCDNLS
jgi:hypothetical protein